MKKRLLQVEPKIKIPLNFQIMLKEIVKGLLIHEIIFFKSRFRLLF